MPFNRRGIFKNASDPRGDGGRVVSAGPITDPYFDNVVLLLDFAGADEGTETSDLSSKAHGVTFSGTASIETSTQFLGTNTVELPGGAGNQVSIDVAVPGIATDCSFGTGDFTVEGVWQFDNTAGASVWSLISCRDSADSGGGITYWAVQYVPVGTYLRFLYRKSSSTIFNAFCVQALSNDTPYHIAVSRISGTLRIHLDGVEVYEATHSNDIDIEDDGSTGCWVGDLPVDGVEFDGFAGAIRITKGVGRYGDGNFTPLTEFYPTS